MRFTPISAYTRAVSEFMTLACVDTCTDSSVRFNSLFMIPRSDAITPSTPIAPRRSAYSSNPSKSASLGKILAVTYIFLLSACTASAAAFSPSPSKFRQAARMPSFFPARYTASAP